MPHRKSFSNFLENASSEIILEDCKTRKNRNCYEIRLIIIKG